MKRLSRSNVDHLLGGVCGGLAEYFQVDPVFVRLGFVLFTLFFGIGLFIYIVLWLITPLHDHTRAG